MLAYRQREVGNEMACFARHTWQISDVHLLWPILYLQLLQCTSSQSHTYGRWFTFKLLSDRAKVAIAAHEVSYPNDAPQICLLHQLELDNRQMVCQQCRSHLETAQRQSKVGKEVACGVSQARNAP